jgi:hypothetical protein
MTLTPELALAYVKELSADYRAGAILHVRGALLAGDERLASAARGIVAGDAPDAPGSALFEGATDAGKVFAIRTPTHAIVITTGPFALPRVARRDLLAALAGLGAESAQEEAIQRIPHDSVEALLGVTN